MLHPPVVSRIIVGLQSHRVFVECQVSGGLPSTTIVGLPEGAVREARDRIKAAIQFAGFAYPDGRVVINLAPSHLNKSGSCLDLAMALSILASTAQINPAQIPRFEFIGELGLFAELRDVPGVLATAIGAAADRRMLIAPRESLRQLTLLAKDTYLTADNLAQVVTILQAPREDSAHPPPSLRLAEDADSTARKSPDAKVIDAKLNQTSNLVVGQLTAKRANVIAAAGGHHLLMVGPPGTGKTMLARSFCDLLPDLSETEALEVATIYGVTGHARKDIFRPPFRDPHHTASPQALLGGGKEPQPGEAVLAHHGVLFLDELPHFKPSLLNALREPIETGEVVISRTRYQARFPCRFQLIAAMNPCPAGRVCKPDACRCAPAQVASYQGRISGPILDRIDIHVAVEQVPQRLLNAAARHTTNAATDREQVARARLLQTERQGGLNAAMSLADLNQHMETATGDLAEFHNLSDRLDLSARSYHKIWRLARTIADLTESERIDAAHLLEALAYRTMDWEDRLGVG